MIVCEYKRTSSKDGSHFGHLVNKEFKTFTELDAYKVITVWNRRGQQGNQSKIIWRFDFISCKPATVEHLNDEDYEKLPFFRSDDC